MVYYKPDNFNFDQFAQQIESKVHGNKTSDNKLSFSAPFSYTKLPIKIVFNLRDDNTSIHFKYRISLFENNVVFLLTMVFLLFFKYHGVNTLGYLSIISGIIFYFFNTIKISNTIKNIFYNLVGGKTDVGMPELWKKQEKWMKDKTLCPACGETKNPYSAKCVNCGLYFNKKQTHFKKVNLSSSKENDVVYEVTKNKK